MVTPARLQVTHMSKVFGPKTVLSDVALTIQPGEIRGIVGQNGSGKSTIAKILSGIYSPEPGCVVQVDGHPLPMPARASDLRRAGLLFVHQDLGLIGDFSVLQNIRIGHTRPGRVTRWIRWDQEAVPARQALAELGKHDISLRRRVDELPPADKAKVAIARALQGVRPGSGTLLFDESTRALPRADLKEFYEVMRNLAAAGTSVLLVSHRLSEVLSVCDTVTVLCDGIVAADGIPTAGLTEDALAKVMLGRELSVSADARRSPSDRGRPHREPAARIRGLSGPGLPVPLDLDLYPGEILGITGRPGSAFEQIPYYLGGTVAEARGTLSLGGRPPMNIDGTSIRERLAQGLVVVPEKRTKDGLALSESVLANITLPRVRHKGRPWHVGSRWRVAEAQSAIRQYAIKPSDHNALVSKLSGGNQQKVMLAKWLIGTPKLLILHEPTQAIDIQAREDIIGAIGRAANVGCAVLLASAEITDLVRLCDRVLVARDDGHVREITAGIDEQTILAEVYGGRLEG
jgi:ribose transport system ATP-binding protein